MYLCACVVCAVFFPGIIAAWMRSPFIRIIAEGPIKTSLDKLLLCKLLGLNNSAVVTMEPRALFTWQRKILMVPQCPHTAEELIKGKELPSV